MGGWLWIASPYAPWTFLGITVLMGGLAAYATGRALASSWRPLRRAIGPVLALAAAAAFLHYVLFGETVISLARLGEAAGLLARAPGAGALALAEALKTWAGSVVVLGLAAALGYRRTRARRMVEQYAFELAPAGLFWWRRR